MPRINEFAIQLYSLREETDKDFATTLRRVGEIGFTGVEFAGYGGLSAPEMKSLLVECGLRPVGSHVSLERLTDALEEELAYNREIGTPAIVLPWYDMKTEEDVRALAARLRDIAPRVTGAGFTFAYHNHAHEFAAPGGRYLLDRLLELVPPEEMALELDIYWAAYADVPYRDYLRANAGRIKLLHLKQMADWETKKCVDLDEGIIDFAEVVALGLEADVEHFILEQEEFAGSPFDGIKKSYRHIMGL